MDCIICGNPVEPWPGGGGYGNSPAPWPNMAAARLMMDADEYRCCDTCNATVVIPLRLAAMR
jgi:hypothetical protein